MRKDRSLAGKALLKVGYTCNNNCSFCHSSPFRRHPDLSTAALKSRIREAAGLGAGMVVLSGGEPTVRDDLADLARYAGSLGLSTGLITNGRRLVYPRFAEELAAAGLRFAYLSFASADPDTHRGITRSASYHEVLGALRNLTRLGVPVTVNTVVLKSNIGSLNRIVDLLAGFRPDKIKFSALELKGAALDRRTALCPPLEACADAVAAAVRHGRARFPGQIFGCEGLAPCLLEDFETLNDDLVSNGFTLFRETFEDRFSPPDYGNRAKAAACFDCVLFDRCPGVFSGYLSAGPKPALRPVVRRRSNALAFVSDGSSLPSIRRSSSRPCPLRAEGGVRRLHLSSKGRLTSYRTRSEDFSDPEIAELLRLSQVYAPRGGRYRGLDFGRDLVKLRRVGSCPLCGGRGTCSPVFEASQSRVFAALERALETVVRRLRGDVLEVGCGSVRFRKLISGLVSAGKLRYTGIDPALPRPEAGRPEGMRLEAAAIEDWSADAGSFDHVLLSRSYNHIRLPSVAFPKLFKLLRPGGRLTVVDGTAFALALEREPEQADSSSFEHYRNHASGQARALVETFGFKTVSERPVTASGSNEWLLTAAKP
ncbi:MAG: radical SAM protein [Elusimicrobia bacterium]|nr:radical SAM protein [Elusimicrobiota bacterium]